MDKLPAYEQLTAQSTMPAGGVAQSAVPAGGVGEEEAGSQQAVWASDAILATRMQLLMSLVGACLPALPQVFIQHASQL